MGYHPAGDLPAVAMLTSPETLGQDIEGKTLDVVVREDLRTVSISGPWKEGGRTSSGIVIDRQNRSCIAHLCRDRIQEAVQPLVTQMWQLRDNSIQPVLLSVPGYLPTFGVVR